MIEKSLVEVYRADFVTVVFPEYIFFILWISMKHLRSSSLHMIHGAFQIGNKAKDWEIDKVLKGTLMQI